MREKNIVLIGGILSALIIAGTIYSVVNNKDRTRILLYSWRGIGGIKKGEAIIECDSPNALNKKEIRSVRDVLKCLATITKRPMVIKGTDIELSNVLNTDVGFELSQLQREEIRCYERNKNEATLILMRLLIKNHLILSTDTFNGGSKIWRVGLQNENRHVDINIGNWFGVKISRIFQ